MNSFSLNKVILVGSLGSNPIFDETKNNREYVKFSLATNEAYKAGNEWKSITDWHSIVAYKEGLLEFAENKLRKGSKAIIEGKLKSIPSREKKGRTVIIVADEITLATPNKDEESSGRPKIEKKKIIDNRKTTDDYEDNQLGLEDSDEEWGEEQDEDGEELPF